MRVGRIVVAEGVEVAFEDTLEESVSKSDAARIPTLFFVYGLGCAISHWKHQMAFFSRPAAASSDRVRMVWMDFRGHGASAQLAPEDRLRLATLADDLAIVSSILQLPKAIFLGQSMGGTVILELAARHPECVGGLVLLGAPIGGPSAGFNFGPFAGVSRTGWKFLIRLGQAWPRVVRDLHARLVPQNDPVRRELLVLAVREIVRAYGFNPRLARTSDIHTYVEELLAVSPNVFLDLAADLEAFRLEDLPEVPRDLPALIIAGEQDKVVPMAQAEALHRWLAASELMVVPHGSHCPHFDDPGLVNSAISEFVLRLRR